jgi:glucosyl-dolichyl phosphate glucuronosyltransferase
MIPVTLSPAPDVTALGAAPPAVSIVVPTFNRSRLLLRTLQSLAAQVEAPSYEVLVVDNNSSDDTSAVVAAFAREWPLVRYLLERRPGASCARNRGIAESRAAIVGFIDDDVEAEPRWVATIHRTFWREPSVDCIGGRIYARWAAPPPSWFSDRHWGPVALQDKTGVTTTVDADHAVPCLMTANFACRRAALELVGGFSPAYLRDEDRELQLRLWRAGKRGLYVPELAVSTEIPCERLEKRYHRRHRIRVAASHARMQYLDRIDRRGRLVSNAAQGVRVLGVPGFIYRSLFRHVRGWVAAMLRLDRDEGFYHETRVLYHASYVWHRVRERHAVPSAADHSTAATPVLASDRSRG